MGWDVAKKTIMVRLCRRHVTKAIKYLWLFFIYLFFVSLLAGFKIFLEDDVLHPNLDFLTDLIMAWLVLCVPYTLARHFQSLFELKRLLRFLSAVIER